MTYYTVAYIGDEFLAIVPEGEDIYAAIKAVEEHAGVEYDNPVVVHSCLVTDEPSSDDCVVFSSRNGSCGFITVREGDADVTYDYVVTAPKDREMRRKISRQLPEVSRASHYS